MNINYLPFTQEINRLYVPKAKARPFWLEPTLSMNANCEYFFFGKDYIMTDCNSFSQLSMNKYLIMDIINTFMIFI